MAIPFSLGLGCTSPVGETGTGDSQPADTGDSQPADTGDSQPTDTGDSADPVERQLFDAHTHITEENIQALADAGLVGVSLFGVVNDADEVIAAARADEDLIFPFAQLRRTPDTNEVVLDETTLGFLEAQLETGLMRGIGELSVRHYETPAGPKGGDQHPADSATLMDIYALAAAWGVPVNLHVEYEFADELARAIEGSPDTVFIWAHMGDAPPDVVRAMVEAHSHLYADISCRHPYYERSDHSTEEQSITDEGTLLPEWAQLFDDHPDRFLWGTDLGRNDRVDLLPEVMDHVRSVLEQLSPEAAAGIAEDNARRLLGLEAASPAP